MDSFFLLPNSDASSETLQSITPADLTSSYQNDNTTSISESSSSKKRGRKGHSKSRTGCFNCKRARIKCKENRPSCDYCAHRGLRCEWPEIQISQIRAMIRHPTPVPVVPPGPQISEPVFNMHDFRYFYHFIHEAHPHQPVGNASVWKHEIPSLASNYDFLLHAMLALGAADLLNSKRRNRDVTEDQALNVAAMSHRVKSIEALNLAVSNGITSLEQGNAMLATCFALLFHSVLFNDGLVEYMAFIRGCMAVGYQMMYKGWDVVFVNWEGDAQVAQIEDGLKIAPLINSNVVVSACRSLEHLLPLCHNSVELRAYGLLMNMARNLITSSQDAYMALRQFYAMFMMASYEDFRRFTSPEEEVCQALLTHFVALQIIMTPISKLEWEGFDNATATDSGSVKWLKPLHARIPPHMREYYTWTLWVEDEATSGRLYNAIYSVASHIPFLDENRG